MGSPMFVADSRGDLITQLNRISQEIRQGTRTVENNTAADLLAAAAAWIADMDGYYRNKGEEPPSEPTWATVGDIFSAALVYE